MDGMGWDVCLCVGERRGVVVAVRGGNGFVVGWGGFGVVVGRCWWKLIVEGLR